MKRLTRRYVDGQAWVSMNHVAASGASNLRQLEKIPRAIDRLATIENILGDDYDLDHLRELVQAEKDGRLVALPCKAGSTIYRIYDDCAFPGDCHAKRMCKGCEYRNLFIEEQAFCLSMLSQNGTLGHPYYLTREEAEAALEREEGDNEE